MTANADPRRVKTGGQEDAARVSAIIPQVADGTAKVRPEWCCATCGRDLRLLPFVQLDDIRIRCRHCPDPPDAAV
jgi:hypothetical protein